MHCCLKLLASILPALPAAARARSGDVTHFIVSPLGDSVVYVADQSEDGVFELFALKGPSGASRPIRLNGLFVRGGSVHVNEFVQLVHSNPEGQRVVYVADAESDEVFELYSVSVAGGRVTKLNGTLPAGGTVRSRQALDSDSSFQISADGRTVVYAASQDSGGIDELYSVPIEGGLPPVKLNPSLSAGPGIASFSLSPAGSAVAFLVDQNADFVEELFGVPIDGSRVPVLLHPFPDILGSFRFSPEGSLVVYQAFNVLRRSLELFSVPVDGSRQPVRLTGRLGNGRRTSAFAVAADGRRAVFTANGDDPDSFELFVASITGRGAPVKLSQQMTSGADVSRFALDVTGKRVVYLADAERRGVPELYSVPTDASAPPVKLNRPLSTGQVFPDFALAPDGGRVVFRSDEEGDSAFVLFSASLTGGTPVYLGGASVSPDFFGAGDFQLSPDSRSVVYHTNPGAPEQLFSVPIAGGASPISLNGPLVAGGNVAFRGHRISSDSRQVLYLADQDTDEVQELYAVPIKGGQAVRLNEPLGEPGFGRDVAPGVDRGQRVP